MHAFEISASSQNCEIIVPQNAPSATVYAATELQSYLGKICGTKLSIRKYDSKARLDLSLDKNYLIVGNSRFCKKLGIDPGNMKPDGFRILSGKNFLVMAGRDYAGPLIKGFRHPLRLRETYNRETGLSAFGETGSLFAVYYLLNKLGVRWFMPGKLGEVVPQRKTIVIDNMDIIESPAFEYRYLYYCNFSDVKDLEYVKWYKRIGFGGRNVVNVNHSFYLFKKYRDRHPEYFAIINGKRDFNTTSQGQGSLCLSEPGVLKQMVQIINDYFQKNPDAVMFPVMPNDSYSNICECGKCRGKANNSMGEEGKFSDYVWGFVNQVAKEVYKLHPDKYVSCCAYGHYKSPPRTISEFSPNVVAVICQMRRNFWDDGYRKRSNLLLQAWSKKISNLYLWEYYNWYYRESHLNGVPVFFGKIIQQNLQFLHSLGVKGEFIEVDGLSYLERKKQYTFMGMMHYPIYLTAVLMWRPEADLNEVLEDYCKKFYGPAANDMKAFVKLAEKIWAMPQVRGDIYIKKSIIDQLDYHLKTAQKKVKLSSVYGKRIEVIYKEFLRARKLAASPIPGVDCIKTVVSPQIDGKLTESCWKKAAKINFLNQADGKKPYQDTEVYLLYDSNNLYIGGKCYVKDIRKLKAKVTERDGIPIWDDDCIEIFLDPAGAQREYYHFIVNVAGVLWDGKHIPRFYSNYQWSSHFTAATYTGDNYWNFEVAIPVRDLGIEMITPNSTWRMNVTRNHASASPESRHSSWSPTFGKSSHTLSRFGSIKFAQSLSNFSLKE